MCDGAQAREQTPVQHLLEVPLTDVLGAQGPQQAKNRQGQCSAWASSQCPQHLAIHPPGLAVPPTFPTALRGRLCPYQHGGPEVKLLWQLGDVDVYRHQVPAVILLHLADDVCQPLKLPLGACHPDEVDLGEGVQRTQVTGIWPSLPSYIPSFEPWVATGLSSIHWAATRYQGPLALSQAPQWSGPGRSAWLCSLLCLKAGNVDS